MNTNSFCEDASVMHGIVDKVNQWVVKLLVDVILHLQMLKINLMQLLNADVLLIIALLLIFIILISQKF